MDTKDFLKDYESTGWQIAPKTYKFLGIAAAINLFVIIILGQFNLLQTKACDSPYVGKVCQVLDYVSLGSTIAGTDTEFSDQAYDPTKIEEGDVTYIDVSGQEPPFTYPAGYFAMANPENQDVAALPPTDFGFPTNNGITTVPLPSNGELPPQVLPTPNNNVANDVPNSPFDFGDAVKTPPVKQSRVPSYNPPRLPKRSPIKNNSPKLPKLPGDDTVADSNSNSNSSGGNVAKNNTNANANTNNANQTADAGDDSGKFNSLPLKNFGETYGEKILKKEIDINAPFTIEIIGKIDENGKIINASQRASADSDPKMTALALDGVSAFSDTKLLKPLYDVIEAKERNKKPKNVKITFSQNKDNLQAIIQTETKDEASAASIQSLLSFFIKNSPAFMREGSDESKLLQQAQLKTSGKIFIIDFLISNEDKTQMIEKSLKSLAEQKKQSNNGENASQAVSAK